MVVEGEALLLGEGMVVVVVVVEVDEGIKIMGAFWFGTFLSIAGKIVFMCLCYACLLLSLVISSILLVHLLNSHDVMFCYCFQT